MEGPCSKLLKTTLQLLVPAKDSKTSPARHTERSWSVSSSSPDGKATTYIKVHYLRPFVLGSTQKYQPWGWVAVKGAGWTRWRSMYSLSVKEGRRRLNAVPLSQWVESPGPAAYLRMGWLCVPRSSSSPQFHRGGKGFLIVTSEPYTSVIP